MSNWARRQRVSSEDLDAALAASYRHAVHTHEKASDEQLRRELINLRALDMGPSARRGPGRLYGRLRDTGGWLLDEVVDWVLLAWKMIALAGLGGALVWAAIAGGAGLKIVALTVSALLLVAGVLLSAVYAVTATIRIRDQAIRHGAESLENGHPRRAGWLTWGHAHEWAGSSSWPPDDD
jgi:hypothetical protein